MASNFCYGCFRMIELSEQVCPVCSYRHHQDGPPPFALACGTALHAGKYLTGKMLGQGGFGITYLGLDQALNLKVAVKEYFPVNMVTRLDSGGLVWHAPDEDRERGRKSFVKEAQRMAKIHTIPNVVNVRDVFFENKTAYIVMDFIEGVTLHDRLKQTGKLSAPDCFAVLLPIMNALCQAHALGLIHRDISPDNIMIDPQGAPWLLDLDGCAE